MIRSCTCKHEFQDQRYGKGNRVFNEVPMKNGTTELRCTVCKTKVVTGSTKKEEVKK